jgi:hypothetical protein
LAALADVGGSPGDRRPGTPVWNAHGVEELVEYLEDETGQR